MKNINFGNKSFQVNEKNNKMLNLFYNAGLREKKGIPAMLLTGKASSGKTSMAENFASIIGAKCLFLQCYPGLTSDNLYIAPSIEGILRNDSMNAVKKGLLINAIQSTTDGDVVVILDEIDKAREEVDAFLLDFIQNGRISTGNEIYHRSTGNIWIFLTSNGKRQLAEPLLSRCRQLELKLAKEEFLKIMNLQSNHYLGTVFEKDENFSVRQAKAYLKDLELLEVDFDEDVLNQYLTEDIEISSKQELDLVDYGELELKLISTYISPSDDERLIFACKNFLDVQYNEKNNNYIVYPKDLKELNLLYSEGFYFNGWIEVNSFNKEIKWLNKKNNLQFGLYIADENVYQIIKTKLSLFINLNDDNFEKFIKSFDN